MGKSDTKDEFDI